MKRTNAKPVGDLLQEFYKDNPALQEKILEMRILRAWGEVLGASVTQATRELYVHHGVLYVSVNSSVLRNELMVSRANLIDRLNKYAGCTVVEGIVIR